MSLSDHWRSMLGKSGDPNPPKKNSEADKTPEPIEHVGKPTPAPAPAAAAPASPPTPPSAPEKPSSTTLEELGHVIAQERKEGEAHLQAMEKEIQNVRLSIEKLDASSKTRRDQTQQTLDYLQQDAEREIKFLDRKLQEDLTHWNKQLSEREKSLEQATRQMESGHLEKKSMFEQAQEAQKESLQRAEQLLKEQETKLTEERAKWRETTQAKEAELLTLRQDLNRRDADLQKELEQHETQRKAAQELWQTRLKELERQSAEKRKSWEEAMKAKEEERGRVHTSLQERQAAWQLEQERRLQDMARRQERAVDKVAALKAHLIKETQNWQQVSQAREEQIQQLKVKLLLSESDGKGRLEQAQKKFQTSVSAVAALVQDLQSQIQSEQSSWKKTMDDRDADIASVKEEVRTKLRHLEADYAQRLGVLQSDKETLNTQFQLLQDQYLDEQTRYAERAAQLQAQQEALDAQHQTRMNDMQHRSETETAALEAQIVSLEKQKADSEGELESLRLHWQEELHQKEVALKDAAHTLGPQEAELRKRFATEEETFSRQSDALKTRLRALDRDMLRARETAERAEKEFAISSQALQKDHDDKEAALQKRGAEQDLRLSKRLEERRLALDAFLIMKKDEETRVQGVLHSKESELTAWAQKLEQLPLDLQKALDEKKAATEAEGDALKNKLALLEADLVKVREESKNVMQQKATELAGLRQRLELQHKDLASSFRSREQVLESERAQVEKQMATAQGEMDRVRSHWQLEIEKKEGEIAALQSHVQQQDLGNAQAIENESKRLMESYQPLERQRIDLSQTLEHERTAHDQAIAKAKQDQKSLEEQISNSIQQAKTDRETFEKRFQDDREASKTKLAQLTAEAESAIAADQTTVAQKTVAIETLEAQSRAQAVAYDVRRRELEHSAAQKARTLQDLIDQMQMELKRSQELFPLELKSREETLARLQADGVEQHTRHQQTMTRYDRAMGTLNRRSKLKEEQLRERLNAVKEETAEKKATRDAEIAALQADITAKEADRQGELDRLAKQFAEERFQLEKSKEEIEWKLKDHKEIAERQMAGRQKEIQVIETELARAKHERDDQLAQRSSAFDNEKQKLQASLSHLQNQLDDLRQNGEATLASKDNELQTLISKSKTRLDVLGEEFNQKVGSWKATNEALKAQIEQAKMHWAQAQDHWETLRKEKTNEIQTLRGELSQWEARLQHDVQTHERTLDAERQTIYSQLHKAEKTLSEFKADLQRRLNDQEATAQLAIQEIESQEASAEVQWAATLEQWQLDKQNLQQEKNRMDHALTELQSRSEHEVRQIDESAAQLRMDIAFRETESTTQRERLRQAMEKELAPLHDRMGELATQSDQEKVVAEARLRAKDDDLRNLKARLAMRDKRVQDEIKRRSKEVEGLRRQLNQEADAIRQRYDTERERFEILLSERRTALGLLESRDQTLRDANRLDVEEAQERLQQDRAQIEENIRALNLQREDMRRRYERLLGENEQSAQQAQAQLDARDQELEAIRVSSRRSADELRKQIEHLRQAQETQTLQSAPTNSAAWSAFELGMGYYQNKQWQEAVTSFEECLSKDPRWGAAYQYLALAHHALGHLPEAATAATQALQQDPENQALSEWADQLRDPNRLKKAS